MSSKSRVKTSKVWYYIVNRVKHDGWAAAEATGFSEERTLTVQLRHAEAAFCMEAVSQRHHPTLPTSLTKKRHMMNIS